jgi:hypothetical protein
MRYIPDKIDVLELVAIQRPDLGPVILIIQELHSGLTDIVTEPTTLGGIYEHITIRRDMQSGSLALNKHIISGPCIEPRNIFRELD